MCVSIGARVHGCACAFVRVCVCVCMLMCVCACMIVGMCACAIMCVCSFVHSYVRVGECAYVNAC